MERLQKGAISVWVSLLRRLLFGVVFYVIKTRVRTLRQKYKHDRALLRLTPKNGIRFRKLIWKIDLEPFFSRVETVRAGILKSFLEQGIQAQPLPWCLFYNSAKTTWAKTDIAANRALRL